MLAGHAADAIVKAVGDHPGSIRLVAIGPLTNVALACQKDKHLISNLASLTVMGGDEGPEPEFNFAQDARAAAEVHSEFACMRHLAPRPSQHRHETVCRP